MKNLRLILLGFAFLPTLGVFGALAQEDNFDFRQARWGMSLEEIKENERGDLRYEDMSRLVYFDELLGKKVSIEYITAEDKLYQAFYRLSEHHMLENKYVRDFFDFKTILTKKYGPPTKDKVIWRSNQFRDDETMWGTAVSIGDLAFYATWETESTAIVATLKGEGHRVDCQIEYISKALSHLALAKPEDTRPRSSGQVKDGKLRDALEDF